MAKRVIFPVEAAPLQNLESYLEEVRAENGYETFRYMLSSGWTKSVNLLRPEELYLRLADLTGLSQEQLFACTLHRFVPHHYSLGDLDQLRGRDSEIKYPLWEHKGISMYLAGQASTRFCPHCWKNRQILLLPWQLRYVTVCYKHAIVLVDTCPNCGERLRINLMAQACARCGQPASGIRASDGIDAETLKACEIAGHTLGILESGDTLPWANLDSSHPLKVMPSHALLRFLWRFGQLLGQRHPEYVGLQLGAQPGRARHDSTEVMLRQSPIREVHQVIAAVGRLLHSWPISYYSLLEQVALIESRAPVYIRFPAMVNRLFPEREYDFLRDEFYNYMQERSKADALLYPWLRYFLKEQGRQHGPAVLVTKQEALRKLKVSDKSLREILASSRLVTTPRPYVRTRHEWELIDACSLEVLHEEQRGRWTLNRVAEYTGLGAEAVLAMVRAGLLSAEQGPKHGSARVWVFRRETLLSQMREFLARVPWREETGEGEGLSLQEAMRTLSWIALSIPDVLLAVTEGRFPAYLIRKSKNFRHLRFARADLVEYTAGIRRAHNAGTLSTRDVIKLMKCHVEVLQRLHAARLLSPVSKRSTKRNLWRYNCKDVEAFLDRYIGSAEAASLLGCARLSVQKWAREGRVPVVLGPQIDGRHAYLFDRHELATWRHEHLRVGEAAQVAGVSIGIIQRWASENRITPLDGMGGVHRWFARSEVEAFRRTLELRASE